jgi:hypothetical protein
MEPVKPLLVLIALATTLGCTADATPEDVGEALEEATDEGDVDGQQTTRRPGRNCYQQQEYCEARTNLCGFAARGGGVSGTGTVLGTRTNTVCNGRVTRRGTCSFGVNPRTGCPTCSSGTTCVLWGRCQPTTSCGWAG